MNPLRQTEQAILVEGREWTRRRLEQQLQQDAAALPTLCPKTGLPLTNTRWRDLQLETVAGLVKRNRPAAPSYDEGCGCGRMAG